MGEIADALRRARGLGSPEQRTRRAEPPRPAFAAEPARGAPRDEAAPMEALPEIGGIQLERLSPADPAIALDEAGSAEASRKIAVRVRAELEARGARSVAIVSAGRDEGKTTVACNLALALASMSQGRQVALVDLDLRKPSVANALGLRSTASIEQVLQGSLRTAEVQISVRQPAIDIYPALHPQRSSHELLVHSRFARLIEQLEQRYAAVVIDTSPVLLVPDASLILKHVSCCIPIARTGQTRERSFRELIDTLPKGVVMDALLNGGRAPSYYSSPYASESEESVRHARTSGSKRWRLRRRAR